MFACLGKADKLIQDHCGVVTSQWQHVATEEEEQDTPEYKTTPLSLPELV